MKIGIVITARLGSSRLKRKHLLEVAGKPLLYYLLARIEREFYFEIRSGKVQIVIATSDELENREFEKLLKNKLVSVFYGSINNIPLRHLEAARANDLSGIIAVDGDDILCSVESMRHVFLALKNGHPYVVTRGLPFGMNSMGYSRSFLQSSLLKYNYEVLETGWGRIFNKDDLNEIILCPFDFKIPMRFTIDYLDDFNFFQKVITILGKSVFSAKDDEIISTVIEKKLYKLNEQIGKEYWSNFNQQVISEDNRNERQ